MLFVQKKKIPIINLIINALIIKIQIFLLLFFFFTLFSILNYTYENILFVFIYMD
jgi:hypothetical protein